ncbi:MAG: sigma-70 family RNA polymerase sigma factor [Chloroflexota bacterium]
MESNTQNEDTQRLALRAQRGDERAVMQLFERYEAQIYRYVTYRILSVDALDVTTQIFEQMVRGLPTFNYTDGSFEAYLYKVAADSVADYVLQRGWRQMQTNQASNEDFELSADDSEHADHERVRKALNELSYIEQGIIILRLIEGYTCPEVADILRIPTDTVLEQQRESLYKLAKLL